MADGAALGRAFAAAHPEDAARVLEGLPPAEVAQYLGGLPRDEAARLLAAMLPLPAADVLAREEPGRAVEAVRGLPPDRAAAVLRCLPAERREALLSALRPGRRAAVGLLMAYPDDTVGAWADPRVLAVRRDAAAGWARRAVARAGAPAACELYVVEGDRRLAGLVPVGRLLRSAPGIPLERLMERDAPALSARAGLGEARADSGWVGHAALPVVDGHGRLVGALSAAALERALGAPERGDGPAGEGALGVLVGAYLQAAGDLLRAGWALLAPPARAGRGDRR
ncbi:MAG TPA: hypothetical protein VKA55_05830 [Gammaproteobacteria bacterium]|nr:hypothetical protein [Gammaproteobacteria bacterium]